MTIKTTGNENYHFHTHKTGMYNFISQCGYSFLNVGTHFSMWVLISQCGYSFLNVGTHFSMWVLIKNEYGP